jgi:nucleotide-binding universal stress UspA family protein
MSYKTILVHADQSRHSAARIRIASKIAIAENAHLIGIAMTGISRYLFPGGDVSNADVFVAAHIESLHDSARSALDAFNTIASGMGVLSTEARLVDDDPDGGLSLQARYADLVVIGQTDPNDTASSIVSDLPQYVMLHCARPVLVVPYAGRFENVGDNVLVAWDGSREASRAVANAIPLLKRASKVTIAVFNPFAEYDVHGEQPGADIALYLARHNINVEVQRHTVEGSIGDALLSLAADLGSDLLVMGGYGHARVREVMLGGVTRTVLKEMTLPVLMSH